jgi:hypothetical protein
MTGRGSTSDSFFNTIEKTLFPGNPSYYFWINGRTRVQDEKNNEKNQDFE